MASSMMRHSAAAPRTLLEDPLAHVGIIFHFPSILLVIPFGLFIFAPLVQIALMTFILGLILRARRSQAETTAPLSNLRQTSNTRLRSGV